MTSSCSYSPEQRQPTNEWLFIYNNGRYIDDTSYLINDPNLRGLSLAILYSNNNLKDIDNSLYSTLLLALLNLP